MGVGIGVGVGVGVGPQMMLDKTNMSSPSVPSARAVADSSVSLADVTKPVPSSGVCVLSCVNGSE